MAEREIKCVVTCRDQNDKPRFFPVIVCCTDYAVREEYHYREAQEAAEKYGYREAGIVFDEYDGPAWLFDKFAWDNVPEYYR